MKSPSICRTNIFTCINYLKSISYTCTLLLPGDLSVAIEGIEILLHNINKKFAQQQREITSFREQLEHSYKIVRDSLNFRLESINQYLVQHKQIATSDIKNLHTSLNTTISKLESLMIVVDQLVSDHNQIQSNISNIQHTNTRRFNISLLNDLTQELENVQDDVTFIREEHSCGGHGWRPVAHLDMRVEGTTCPYGWAKTYYSIATCGRSSPGRRICDSAFFNVSGGEYSRICGKIRGYQFGFVLAFNNSISDPSVTIDQYYVDGISLTHGENRTHIWTFAAGLSEDPLEAPMSYICPCDNNTMFATPPYYVGEDYFCESAVHLGWSMFQPLFFRNDILWDGKDCLPSSTCCSRRNPPYFYKQLPNPTSDNIEARICLNNIVAVVNIAVELVELYVQ